MAPWLWLPVEARADAPESHQAWSIEEGLPGASVQQAFQSRDGYLWIATDGGAARFDGAGFQIFRRENEPAFLSNDISAIAEGATGSLWFGTSDGLVERNGSAFRRLDERSGLPSSDVLALAAAPDESLLVLTSRGLIRLDGSGIQPIPGIRGAPLALQSMPDGSVLALTSEGQKVYGRSSLVRPPAQAEDSAPGEAVLGLQAGPEGSTWARSARSVRLRTPRFERVLTVGSDLPGTRVTTLFVDRQGTGWIGTNRGLFTLKPQPRAAVQAVNALRSESILSVMEDREGNIWIGTEASGLHVLRPRKFRSEAAAAGEIVTAISQASDGAIWFGTREDGVRRIAHGTAEQPVPAASLTSPVVLSMAPGRNGDLWVGTPDGLNRIRGKQVQRYTSSSGMPDDFARSILVDRSGTVWAGTRRGLARIQGGSVTTLTAADGLGSSSIGPLLEAGSEQRGAPELWVGTAAGLSHLRGKRIESFSPFGDRSRNVVTALAQDADGSLWVGLHGGGLSRFAAGRFSPVRNAALPRELTSIALDQKGFLWLRGASGIYRAPAAAVRACAANAASCSFNVAYYAAAEGMPSGVPAAQGEPSMWQSKNGELWIATRKGIAVTDPAGLPLNPVPPLVVMERFAVDEAAEPLGGSFSSIPAGHNRYTFEYAALSFTQPLRNRYRYMLEGFDKGWHDGGALRTVSYTSLPSRRYRFRVEAQNNDGVWSEGGAEVRFRVLPPFYRTGWFYGLCLLAAAGLAAAALQLRLRAAQRRFALVLRERNRVAREIHDTLAQDLVSVSLQLEIAEQSFRARDLEQAASQLRSARKLVKDGLETARQSIWNLRANAAEDSLPARLGGLVQRFQDRGAPPRLKISGAFRALAAPLEGNILRVAQESLANAYRHAEASEVQVNLHYASDALRLSVQDNGRGFRPEAARSMDGHYGLRGLEERAAALGALLTVASSPGGGTTVTLLLPLTGRERRPPL